MTVWDCLPAPRGSQRCIVRLLREVCELVMLRVHEEIDRVVCESDIVVRIGTFRCHPDNPSLQDTGPVQN